MWIEDLARLRAARVPAVLATIIAVRGHAPREPGAKLVVSEDQTFGSIGGGNLEMLMTERARALLRELSTGQPCAPVTEQLRLNDKAPAVYGKQCCGGEVSVLLEPVPVPATVAIFGLGHVGLELVRILARHEVDLVLCDARAEQLEQARAAAGPDARARIDTHLAVLGEQVVSQLPAGAHVLIMTHDHAEDFHLCDAALRQDAVGRLGLIGLIGSAAKWARFTKMLTESGHSPAAIARITCPVGLPGITGKHPAVIAVGIAADLMGRLSQVGPPRR